MRTISLFAIFAALVLAPPAWSQGIQERSQDRDRDTQPVTDVDQDREREQQQNREQDETCPGFIDEDGDGVCDNCLAEHDPEQEREQAQDRVQDQTCPGFVDEDGDGVCDNCLAEHDPQQDREQAQDRDQDQTCPGFIDEDGDGVCDLCLAEHDLEQERARRRFIRGDADGNGWRQLTDAVYILRGLFHGGYLDCTDAADVNDDGGVDISDPVVLLQSLFSPDARPIPVPCRNAGNDPTPDGLVCD